MIRLTNLTLSLEGDSNNLSAMKKEENLIATSEILDIQNQVLEFCNSGGLSHGKTCMEFHMELLFW